MCFLCFSLGCFPPCLFYIIQVCFYFYLISLYFSFVLDAFFLPNESTRKDVNLAGWKGGEDL